MTADNEVRTEYTGTWKSPEGTELEFNILSNGESAISLVCAVYALGMSGTGRTALERLLHQIKELNIFAYATEQLRRWIAAVEEYGLQPIRNATNKLTLMLPIHIFDDICTAFREALDAGRLRNTKQLRYATKAAALQRSSYRLGGIDAVCRLASAV